MNTPRILITGHSGFVGSYLVAACRSGYPGAALFGLSDHPAGAASAGDQDIIALQGNIVEPEQVRAAVARARPDLVFHLAGQASVAASWSDPAQALAVNAGGVVHLLEALRAESLSPRVVVVGSGEQYGFVPAEQNPVAEGHPLQPISPYAVAKAAQDLFGYQYFAAYGLPIVRTRSFNHFGPRQSPVFVVANFARQIAAIEAGQAAPVLLVGNLAAQRDLLPVEDVVRAYLAAADRGQPGMAYNVGSGQARTIQSVLDQLLALARVAIEVREDPARMRPADLPILVADTTRLRAHTGWAPAMDFVEALGRTLDYWRTAVRQA